MKQYKIDSSNVQFDDTEDCFLADDDPIHELKIAHMLGGLGSEQRLAEYRSTRNFINKDSNVSLTAAEKVQVMKDNNIKKGSPEYIKLWFPKL